MARIAVLLAALLAVAVPSGAQAAGPAKTKRILAQQMAQAGGYSGAYVLNLDTGEALYARNADAARIPASVEKLYTSAAALMRYGPQGALTTTVLAGTAPD